MDSGLQKNDVKGSCQWFFALVTKLFLLLLDEVVMFGFSRRHMLQVAVLIGAVLYCSNMGALMDSCGEM